MANHQKNHIRRKIFVLIIYCHFLQAHKHSYFSVTVWYSFMRIRVVGVYSWLLISYKRMCCTMFYIHSFTMLDIIIISLFLKYSDNVSTSQGFIYFMLTNVYIKCNLAIHMCWRLQIGFWREGERERKRVKKWRGIWYCYIGFSIYILMKK